MEKIIDFFNLEFIGVSLWIWIAALMLIALVVLLILLIVKFKNRGVVVVEDVKIKNHPHNFEYKKPVDKNKEITLNLLERDFLLKRGVVYVAKEEEILLPGKYSVLCAEDDIHKFNIRLNGLVREYQDNDTIIIKEGEEICSVSHTTILR